MPIWQKRPFSKKHTSSHARILTKKRPFFQKHRALMSFFSNFSWKTPCCHAHIRSKKRQVWQKYKILWTSKVNRMPYFFQKRPLSKKTLLSFAYFVKKNVYSLKNTVLSCNLFHFFFKSPFDMPKFGQKNVKSVKTTMFMGQQSQ